jgi:hypothetical protein
VEVFMRTTGRLLAAVAAVVGLVWACGGEKSPTQPTPATSCTVGVSPGSLSFGSAGGSAAVSVSVGTTCAWTSSSDRAWMAIASGASGSGAGTVSIAVTANAATTARTGTLTVGGVGVPVQQDGAAVVCSVSIAPSSASYSKDAATGSVAVTVPSSCGWTAVSTVDWITVTGGTGTGPASVGYSVARNTSPTPRTGTIQIGETTFTIEQQGDAGTCQFRVAPVTINACMSAGYELVTTVITDAACPWTAAPDASWISLSGPVSRVGPGDVRFRISDNYDAPRLGVIKLRWDTPTAGQNVQVAQAGCRYSVSTTAINAAAAGGTFTFDVYQQSDPYECGGPLQNGCVWTAKSDSPWLAITSSMPRTGDDRVSFSVAPNSGGARSGVITVRDKIVMVNQAPR